MFALFFSLYYAMFVGKFNMYDLSYVKSSTMQGINLLGQFATSIFGDNTMNNLGDIMEVTTQGFYPYIAVVSFVLALITCIGIVIMAVKGIKRVFSIFFMGIR